MEHTKYDTGVSWGYTAVHEPHHLSELWSYSTTPCWCDQCNGNRVLALSLAGTHSICKSGTWSNLACGVDSIQSTEYIFHTLPSTCSRHTAEIPGEISENQGNNHVFKSQSRVVCRE